MSPSRIKRPVISISPNMLLLLAMLAAPVSVAAAAQPQDPAGPDVTVYGALQPESVEMIEGPEIKGIISARSGDRIQVATADGASQIITINEATRISARKGLFGLDKSKLAADALLNGLPITVKTLQSGDGLVASQIKLQNKDLRTASMIRSGTDQRFAEQTAATQELRGRMGDIDQYNVKGTTNVTFDIGKAILSAQAKADLCAAATQAQGMDNALLLVVGYTDSTGSQEFNQALSERRAGSVVNHLQQTCGWKPYRMLTPTGMSEADPVASNESAEGKAQNRRVAVNILVSKGLDGIETGTSAGLASLTPASRPGSSARP